MCACVRVCVRACVRAYVRARVACFFSLLLVFSSFSQSSTFRVPILQAMTSISKPIEVRYPVANGIDGKTRKAAGLEYETGTRHIEALLSNNSDLASAMGSITKVRLKASCERARMECTPVLPDSTKPKAKGEAKGDAKDKDTKFEAASKGVSRKSGLGLEGSPKKGDADEEEVHKKSKKKLNEPSEMTSPDFDNIATSIATLPVVVANLQTVADALAASDRTWVDRADRLLATERANVAQLEKELQRKQAEADKKITAAEDKKSAAERQLAVECAKAAKFEAMAEALKAQLQDTAAQAKLWHDMFVDLQDRGERKEEKLVSNLAMSQVAKKEEGPDLEPE